MLAAADEVAQYLDGVELEAFLGDSMLRSAVAYQLLIVGEAAARVSADMQDRHEMVPWRLLGDFRSVLAHGYFALTWPDVWDSAVDELPPLRDQIFGVLAVEFPPEERDHGQPSQG